MDAGIAVIAVSGNHDTEVLPRLAREIPELRLLGAGAQSKVEVQLAPGPKFRMQPGRAYLLPEFYAW